MAWNRLGDDQGFEFYMRQQGILDPANAVPTFDRETDCDKLRSLARHYSAATAHFEDQAAQALRELGQEKNRNARLEILNCGLVFACLVLTGIAACLLGRQ